MKISEVIIDKVEHLRKNLIPDDVHVEITRNYGETASDKVSELLWHLDWIHLCSNSRGDAGYGMARGIGRVFIRSNYVCLDLVELLYDGLYS